MKLKKEQEEFCSICEFWTIDKSIPKTEYVPEFVGYCRKKDTMTTEKTLCDDFIKKNESLQTHYFDCQCYASEHILRFVYDPEYNELHAEIQLMQYRNIFQRMWLAIKYIFNLSQKYGYWDCWLLKKDDCTKIISLLHKVEKNEDISKKF